MKLTAKIKLAPTTEQHQALKDTLHRANSACNFISAVAWDAKVFRQFGIHKLTYKDVRARFALSAQMSVRAIGKVADAYKVGKKRQRTFKKLGAFPYDSRILSWRLSDQTVSIWTLEGRQRMPFLAGERQLELLQSQRGETDLAYIGGEFYLLTTCDVEEPEPIDVEEYLGVDMGIAQIATDSDGNIYAGGTVNALRKRHAKLRGKLQKKGTKSSRRLLKKRRRKEQRFANDVNHCIAKELVLRAKHTGRGIAVENLKGIRNRIRVRRAQRRQHHSWAFSDLRLKLEYKAKLHGVPFVTVDPRNTSRLCSACGYTDKANRRSQSEFTCRSCGASFHADYNAAVNIGRRAVVNRPNVSDAGGTLPVAPGTSPSALAVGS